MRRELWRRIVHDTRSYLTSLELTWPEASETVAARSLLLSVLWENVPFTERASCKIA